MIIERTKNTITGTIWGMILKVGQILLPFAVRTILIKKLGIEYLGISSLFASILQVLCLTELGFGTAAVYCLYKPIATDDYSTIRAIMAYLKKIYRVIGFSVLGLGLCCLPFLEYMVSGNVPSDVNLHILFVIFLLNTVLSYLLFAYKSSLLYALQEVALTNKIALVTMVLKNVIEIMLLFAFANYYVYVAVLPVFTIISNLITSWVVDKYYSNMSAEGELSAEVKAEIKSKLFPLMAGKLGGIVVNASDTLIISSFVGLATAAIYNNYFLIMSGVASFLVVGLSAMSAGIGNSLVVESLDKNYEDFNKFAFINNWLVVPLTACLICLYQHFMVIWVGADNTLEFSMAVLFAVYFYFMMSQRILVTYKDAGGIWKEDLTRGYFVVFLNIAINLISIRYIGVYGVVTASIMTFLVTEPWLGWILHKHIFKRSSKNYQIKLIYYFVVGIIACYASYLSVAPVALGGVVGFVTKGIIAFIVSNLVMLLCFFKCKDFNVSVKWIKTRFFKGRL